MAKTSLIQNNQRNKKAQQLTPFQKQQLDTYKKINDIVLNAEASLIGIIYKDPDRLSLLDLDVDDLSNNAYKSYLAIANGVVKEGMRLTDINCGIYLAKHRKLQKVWDEFGGWKTVSDAGALVDPQSFGAFVSEIKKWNAVKELVKMGFPVGDKFSEFSDMNAEEIYSQYEGKLNHVFANVDTRIRTYDGFDGLEDLIEEWDKGQQVGLPIGPNAKTMALNNEIGGLRNGNIYCLAGSTGSGKSTLLINYVVPSVIKYKRPCVFIINEEDETKVKREIMLWCCTNILNHPIPKVILRDGHFDDDVKETLYKAAKWLKDQTESHLLTIVPLETYTADLSIKIMKKYNKLFGVSLFILDTMKESSGTQEEGWRSILHDSIKLYDTVKPSVLNVALVVSMQIAKSSLKAKHLSIYDIGMSRSATDVYSACMMFRRADISEMRDGKRAIKYWVDAGHGSRIEHFLEPVDAITGKQNFYLIWFISKNRFGQQDTYSLVTQFDFSTNTFRDLGKCVIPEDM